MNDEPTLEKGAARLDTGTKLAYERTYLAHERTQMAWVRTALALIGFGFTIAKFFDYLKEKQGGQTTLMSPHGVGILMISIGLVSLALAAVQRRQAIQALREQCPSLPVSLAGVMSGLLALLGILALIGALIRQ